jgi:protein-tyrosine phosphatase
LRAPPSCLARRFLIDHTLVNGGEHVPAWACRRSSWSLFELATMIDLHSHVLPGIDDGASSWVESDAMLRRWRALGFQTVVATPHLKQALDQGYLDRIEQAYAEVLALAAPLGVTVLRGFENLLSPDLPDQLLAGVPLSLGESKAVLVELPFRQWPHHADHTFFALQTAGFQPILAHPERYADVQRDPTLAVQLAERGIALQVNIGSLTGLYGKSARKTAETLFRRNAVALVASDAHGSGATFDHLERGLERVEELAGHQARVLLSDRARMLLDGQDRVPLPIPKEDERLATGWRRVFR